MSKMIKCKNCSKEMSVNAKSCPECGAASPIYGIAACLWVIVFILCFVLVMGTIGSSNREKVEPAQEVYKDDALTEIVVEHSSALTFDEDKSEDNGENTITENKLEDKVEDDVPTEYKSALRKAKSYANMDMSKAGVYDQLVSEYGGQFTPEEAQYAVDNVDADWKENALKRAESYQESMAMSPKAIYDQLVSEYGGQFTAEEAQYAVDNLN